MSEEQARVLWSPLLEIDLTLTVAGLRNRLRGRSHSSAMEGACPLDTMGHCDPRPNCQGALVVEPSR